MVSDPYKILGISPGASQEEIKKAYRQKAKENHPDLHPDDPNATRKMNEINEAYDMLTHPEKYQARQQQDQQRRSQQGYRTDGSYGQQQSNSYRQQGSRGGYNPFGHQGSGGWQSSGGWFDFDDLFDFGGQQQSALFIRLGKKFLTVRKSVWRCGPSINAVSRKQSICWFAFPVWAETPDGIIFLLWPSMAVATP